MQIIPIIIGLMFLVAPFPVFALPNTYECIRWLREARGIDISGNAWEIHPNISTWNIDAGMVLLQRFGPNKRQYHGAEILGFEWDEHRQTPTFIWIISANKEPGQVIVEKVAWEDPTIRGVYSPIDSSF